MYILCSRLIVSSKAFLYNLVMRVLKFLIFIYLCCLIIFPADLLAEEIFIYFKYCSNGKVYRILTDDEYNLPIGYFFESNSYDNFYVDSMKNFRFIKKDLSNSYYPIEKSIYRQVFTGSAKEADFGKHGQMVIDRRDEFVKDAKNSPIYRPLGAPFSCGPGNKQIKKEFLPPGTLYDQEKPGKSWFRLPNSCWYQSWDNTTVKSLGKKTFHIYFDQLESRKINWLECYWRGQTPGFVFNKEVGVTMNERLRRVKFDGALSPLNEKDIFEFKNGKETGSDHFWLPGLANKKDQIYFYTWQDKKAGKIYLNNELINQEFVVESKNKSSRFLGLSRKNNSENWAYALGKDVVENWLKKNGTPVADFSIDLVAFGAKPNDVGCHIAVYARNQGKLYYFNRNETLVENKFEDFKIFEVGKNLTDLLCTEFGEVYFAKRVILPADINNFLYGSEYIEVIDFDDEKSFQITSEEEARPTSFNEVKNVTGRIVFSQVFKEQVFLLNKTQKTPPSFIGEVFLNKKYYSRRFNIAKATSEIFFMPVTDFLTFLNDRKANLSEIKGSVSDFPDQYQEPLLTKLAIFSGW